MTIKELYEFAKKYNLEDTPMLFLDGCTYSINHAYIRVDFSSEDNIKRIILEE